MQNLPLELEKYIYHLAFAIDAQFIADKCYEDKNYLRMFIEEHSTFLINKIDWFDLFYFLISKNMEYPYYHDNLIYNLNFLVSLINTKKIQINKYKVKSFYQSIRAFGGDNFYEYFLDDHPYLEKCLIFLSI